MYISGGGGGGDRLINNNKKNNIRNPSLQQVFDFSSLFCTAIL